MATVIILPCLTLTWSFVILPNYVHPRHAVINIAPPPCLHPLVIRGLLLVCSVAPRNNWIAFFIQCLWYHTLLAGKRPAAPHYKAGSHLTAFGKVQRLPLLTLRLLLVPGLAMSHLATLAPTSAHAPATSPPHAHVVQAVSPSVPSPSCFNQWGPLKPPAPDQWEEIILRPRLPGHSVHPLPLLPIPPPGLNLFMMKPSGNHWFSRTSLPESYRVIGSKILAHLPLVPLTVLTLPAYLHTLQCTSFLSMLLLVMLLLLIGDMTLAIQRDPPLSFAPQHHI